MEKKCMLLMAVVLLCTTDAKPDPRADHQVGSVLPANVMIMTSDVERGQGDPKIFQPVGVDSVSTPEAIVTAESLRTDAGVEDVDDQLASPADAIAADQVITESVPTAGDGDQLFLPFFEDVKSTVDEVMPSLKSDDGASDNGTIPARDLVGHCVFNLVIPNRNIPSITYSTNCDFCNRDMYTLTCVPDAFTCASLCAGDRRCSHFTYVANLSGGTCRLKSAAGSGGSWASPVKAPSPYVCGYIGKRAFHNILLGLCLALDINVE